MTITTAMVLAAGKGTRMLPLTLEAPKPLLSVGGKAMLDHVLDRLIAAGVKRIVINASYLAEKIVAHTSKRHDAAIVLSHEDEPLETGGGIKHALPLLGEDPIYVLNSDLPWTENGEAALERMRAAWDPNKMDIQLLMLPRDEANGFTKGDFNIDASGQLHRKNLPQPLSHVFIGVQIVKPALYRAVPEKVFSNNILFDAAEEKGRLYGVVHQGSCYHVGTPADLTAAQAWYAQNTSPLAGEAVLPGERKRT